MQSSKEYLEICYALGVKGCFGKIKGDRRIARGFADLGYEEFLLRDEKKMVSLYTGTASELPDAHIAFFFTVPTVENVIDEILERALKIEELVFVNQRRWNLRLSVPQKKFSVVEHRELETVLAKGLLNTFSE